MVCKIGDGKGSGNSEKLIGVSYTIQECIDTVKQQHPTANGATMSNPCPNKCACYAEFKMQSWSGSEYQSCLFDDVNTNGGGGKFIFQAGVYRRSIFKIRPNILIGLQKLQLRPKDRSRSRLFIYLNILR